MSSTREGGNSDGSSSKRMKQSEQLVFEQSGKIYLDIWQRKLRLFLQEVYGYLADCLVNKTKTPWMDPLGRFSYVDAAGNVLPTPDKTKDVDGYNDYKNRSQEFYDYRAEYQRKKKSMTSVLYNGCLSERSRQRMDEIKKAETQKALDEGDFLGLYLIDRRDAYLQGTYDRSQR